MAWIDSCSMPKQKQPYMPTPAQIVASCAEVQSGWNDKKRERRIASIAPSPVTLQVIPMSDLPGWFCDMVESINKGGGDARDTEED